MRKYIFAVTAVAMVAGFAMGFSAPAIAADKAAPTMSKEDFDEAKTLYFQRCAGCHGVLRKGATGKNLEPGPSKDSKGTLKLGQKRRVMIITLGTEGGMNNFVEILTKEQIAKLAT